jgi:hypothetical protein
MYIFRSLMRSIQNFSKSRDLGHQLGVTGCDFEEELQACDGRIERDRRSALVNKVQLIAPQILGTCDVR